MLHTAQVVLQAFVAEIALAKQYTIPVQRKSLRGFFSSAVICLTKQDIAKSHVTER